jgi:hypothetical protein
MFKNSKVSYRVKIRESVREHRLAIGHATISKPKLASIINSTRSATFPMSIIELRSLLHSMRVRRRFLPETIVIGPFDFRQVVFGITPDQGPDQELSFLPVLNWLVQWPGNATRKHTHSRRTDNPNDDRGRLVLWKAVDHRDMQTRLISFGIAPSLLLRSSA